MRYFFISPWRFGKKSLYLPLADEYLSRVENFVPSKLLQPTSTLNSPSSEGEFLVKEVQKLNSSGSLLVCLDENGKLQSSCELARSLENWESQCFKQIFFCVGGAYGLPEELAKNSSLRLISLSPMTLPHELAMVVLLEQVYRARCIIAGHPYHHGEVSSLSKALER